MTEAVAASFGAPVQTSALAADERETAASFAGAVYRHDAAGEERHAAGAEIEGSAAHHAMWRAFERAAETPGITRADLLAKAQLAQWALGRECEQAAAEIIDSLARDLLA